MPENIKKAIDAITKANNEAIIEAKNKTNSCLAYYDYIGTILIIIASLEILIPLIYYFFVYVNKKYIERNNNLKENLKENLIIV